MRPPVATTQDKACYLCNTDFVWFEIEANKCGKCQTSPLRNQKSHVLFNTLRRASEKEVPVDPFTLKALVEVLEKGDHPPTKYYSNTGFYFFRHKGKHMLQRCIDPSVNCQCVWCER